MNRIFLTISYYGLITSTGLWVGNFVSLGLIHTGALDQSASEVYAALPLSAVTPILFAVAYLNFRLADKEPKTR